VRAGPAARHAATEKGVDLASVDGTGKHGRVTSADVAKVAAPAPVATAPAAAPAAPVAPPPAAPRARAPPRQNLRWPPRCSWQ
jgi:pyruvate dehydrogenase E2 component (dihydrolipoamide acetyltransferase)